MVSPTILQPVVFLKMCVRGSDCARVISSIILPGDISPIRMMVNLDANVSRGEALSCGVVQVVASLALVHSPNSGLRENSLLNIAYNHSLRQ